MNRLLALILIMFSANSSKAVNLVLDVDVPQLVDSSALLAGINGFCSDLADENFDGVWCLPADKACSMPQFEILCDELQKAVEDTNVRVSIVDIAPLTADTCLVQLSIVNAVSAQLLSLFEIVATKLEGRYLFSSVLSRNMKAMQKVGCEGINVYFNNDADRLLAERYVETALSFDRKFGAIHPANAFLCENGTSLMQMFRLLGINYLRDAVGSSWSMVDFEYPDVAFYFYTNRYKDEGVDSHDLFHSRASLAIESDAVNSYMVCGGGYVYGGSWGMSWNEIKSKFKANMKYDAETDWLKLYFERFNFGDSKEKHLLITQFVNALIIEQVEAEQGFDAVVKLLSSGNMNKERQRFFNILESVTGINEHNFNAKVCELIEKSMKF